MADAMAWRPKLEARLNGEQLIELVEGPFLDKPKSMRVGLFGVTAQRIVFFRKKVLGDEFLAFDRAEVLSAEAAEDELSALLGRAGGDARVLVVQLRDGQTLRLKGLPTAEAQRLADLLVG